MAAVVLCSHRSHFFLSSDVEFPSRISFFVFLLIATFLVNSAYLIFPWWNSSGNASHSQLSWLAGLLLTNPGLKGGICVWEIISKKKKKKKKKKEKAGWEWFIKLSSQNSCLLERKPQPPFSCIKSSGKISGAAQQHFMLFFDDFFRHNWVPVYLLWGVT